MIGLIALAAASTGDVPAYLNGNKLLAICESDLGLCQGYIEGVFDTQSEYQAAYIALRKVCAPEGVTVAQITDVVVAYLRKHPATRHRTAAGLAINALSEAFPCYAPGASK